MLDTLDSRDWRSAFASVDFNDALAGDSVSRATAFDREDVQSLLAYSEGKYGLNWLCAGVLTDGRWFFLSAACLNDGHFIGKAFVASERSILLEYGIPEDDQVRLGLGCYATLTAEYE